MKNEWALRVYGFTNYRGSIKHKKDGRRNKFHTKTSYVDATNGQVAMHLSGAAECQGSSSARPPGRMISPMCLRSRRW